MVEERCREGGISLMWKEVLELNILSYSHNHIGVCFEDDISGLRVYISEIYGFPEEQRKKEMRSLLKNLKPMDGMWICF